MLLSIVIPTYKSHKFLFQTIKELHDELVNNNFNFEIILVNDSSDIQTWNTILNISEKLSCIKAFQLYKHFGQHYANHIGFLKAKGDFIITLDDDGQNPPDQINILLEKQKSSNADLVIGVYKEKKHGFLRKIASWFMTSVIRFTFKTPTNFRISNFRLLSRKVVDRIINSSPSFPYTTGQAILFSSVKKNIKVNHRPSARKFSNYGLIRLLSLAWNSIANYSNLPLRYVSIAGFLLSVFSLCIFVFIILFSLIVGSSTPGWASICCLISFLSSMQFMILGIMCEYLYKHSPGSKHDFLHSINQSI